MGENDRCIIWRERQGLRFLTEAHVHDLATEFWCALGEKLDSIGSDSSAQRMLLRSIIEGPLAIDQECLANVEDEVEAVMRRRSTEVEKHVEEVEHRKAYREPEPPPPSIKGPNFPSNKVHPKSNKFDKVGVIGSVERTLAVPIKSKRSATVREGNGVAENKPLCLKAMNVPVLKPDSPQRLTWDLYMMVLILYYAVAVPVRVGFDIDPPYKALENFFTLCFATDIVLNFNTALKDKTEITTNRLAIAKDYFKCWFWIDLIASFPFELVIPSADAVDAASLGLNVTDSIGKVDATAGVNKLGRLGKIFRLLRIFKLLRLLKLGRIMKRMKSLTDGNPNVVTLLRTFTTMGAILHWTACAYWYVVQAEGDEVRDELGPTEFWHPPDYITDPDADFNLQYAYAFFWGISVTMGAGWDIIPGTKVQVAFSSIMITVGALLYITLLGSVTNIVANLSAEKTKKVHQLEAVLSYLKRRMVSKPVFKQVREYYEFMWEDAGAVLSEPQKQLDRLPVSLQITLAAEMHRNLLSQIPVFSNLPAEAAFFLVKCWKRAIYVPGDVIVQTIGADERLYIVIRGKVRSFVNATHRSKETSEQTDGDMNVLALFVTELQVGNYFGEQAMLDMGSVSEKKETAMAASYAELLYITKQQFGQLVDKFHLHDFVESIKVTYRSRKARIRWRVAIALVRVIVRLNRFVKLTQIEKRTLPRSGSSFLHVVRRVSSFKKSAETTSSSWNLRGSGPSMKAISES